jgi:hypothetical protein
MRDLLGGDALHSYCNCDDEQSDWNSSVANSSIKYAGYMEVVNSEAELQMYESRRASYSRAHGNSSTDNLAVCRSCQFKYSRYDTNPLQPGRGAVGCTWPAATVNKAYFSYTTHPGVVERACPAVIRTCKSRSGPRAPMIAIEWHAAHWKEGLSCFRRPPKYSASSRLVVHIRPPAYPQRPRTKCHISILQVGCFACAAIAVTPCILIYTSPARSARGTWTFASAFSLVAPNSNTKKCLGSILLMRHIDLRLPVWVGWRSPYLLFVPGYIQASCASRIDHPLLDHYPHHPNVFVLSPSLFLLADMLHPLAPTSASPELLSSTRTSPSSSPSSSLPTTPPRVQRVSLPRVRSRPRVTALSSLDSIAEDAQLETAVLPINLGAEAHVLQPPLSSTERARYLLQHCNAAEPNGRSGIPVGSALRDACGIWCVSRTFPASVHSYSNADRPASRRP